MEIAIAERDTGANEEERIQPGGARQSRNQKNRKIPLLHLPRRGGEKRGGFALSQTVEQFDIRVHIYVLLITAIYRFFPIPR